MPLQITAEFVKNFLEQLCNSPENTMVQLDEPAWAAPLIGFACGADAMFGELKQSIGQFYWKPEEAFAIAHGSVDPANLTVISWILPQTQATKLDHRKMADAPSRRWALSRKYGNDFLVSSQKKLVEVLDKNGVRAVAPTIMDEFEMYISENFGMACAWSERHTAHIAGLGTFGLCDGLITPAGKAMRCASVIAEARIEPTPRKYSGPYDYCLYHAKGTCKACIKRCPVDAISEAGHNKPACRDFAISPYVRENYKIDAYGCGLCQVKVPCESGIPKGL